MSREEITRYLDLLQDRPELLLHGLKLAWGLRVAEQSGRKRGRPSKVDECTRILTLNLASGKPDPRLAERAIKEWNYTNALLKTGSDPFPRCSRTTRWRIRQRLLSIVKNNPENSGRELYMIR
jgi:hypothetical protein